MYKIKSKSTIKLFHENNRIHIPRFVALCRLFGDDYYHYINKINPVAYSDHELKIGDKVKMKNNKFRRRVKGKQKLQFDVH